MRNEGIACGDDFSVGANTVRPFTLYFDILQKKR